MRMRVTARQALGFYAWKVTHHSVDKVTTKYGIPFKNQVVSDYSNIHNKIKEKPFH